MKIAIPLAEGRVSMHFGHCEEFAVVDVDEKTKQVLERETILSPPHQPGLLPEWLGERDVKMIIAGGMGVRAQSLFAQQGIAVMVGAPNDPPDEVVRCFLEGSLQTGANVCDH